MKKQVPADARLYGIVDMGYVSPEDVEQVTTALLQGGIRICCFAAAAGSFESYFQILDLTFSLGGLFFGGKFPFGDEFYRRSFYFFDFEFPGRFIR